MAKFHMNDPLASDRTLNTSRIDVPDYEHTGTENSISLYDAFSFSKTGSSKIASQRPNTRLRNLKGNITIKNQSIFELMKMLALSETRYSSETAKLSMAISKTMHLNSIGVVGLIALMKPLVKSTIRAIKNTYLYRWKANVGYTLKRKIELPKRKANAKKIFACLRKWVRREMIKTFIEVRERACLVDGIKRRRPSVKSTLAMPKGSKSPGSKSPDSKYAPNSDRSLNSSRNINSSYMNPDIKLDDRKKEFKKTISSKYKAGDKPLERSLGSSYFRNN